MNNGVQTKPQYIDSTLLQTLSKYLVAIVILYIAFRYYFLMDPTEQTPLLNGEPGAAEHEEYSPSVDDVFRVKANIFEKTRLPIDLIDSIIDYAQYWPHTTTVTTSETIVRTGRNQIENVFIVG